MQSGRNVRQSRKKAGQQHARELNRSCKTPGSHFAICFRSYCQSPPVNGVTANRFPRNSKDLMEKPGQDGVACRIGSQSLSKVAIAAKSSASRRKGLNPLQVVW